VETTKTDAFTPQLAWFATFAALGTAPASAEEKVTFFCEFPTFHEPESLVVQNADDFSMVFIIEADGSSATMVGNAATVEVTPVLGDSSVTFLEFVPSGIVQTTTVTDDGSVVHSRHTVIADELVPSQYYGQCEIR